MSWYVALGDSLAVGWQPIPATNREHRTQQGYVDDLYRYEKTRIPGLELMKLGCQGESTQTFQTGGLCAYREGSQQAAAAAFISSHKASIAFVTIDLGANNVDYCAPGLRVDINCVTNGITQIQADMPKIEAQLRAAGGPQMKIVGMNYYDPYLFYWLTGSSGQTLAQLSATFATQVNSDLRSSFSMSGSPTADVAAAFDTYNFSLTTSLPGHGAVPANVYRICLWTWMCAIPPVGPNLHANAVGYQVIANAFKPLI